MKQRTFGITFIQILIVVCGIFGLCFLVYLCFPAYKVLFSDGANFGDAFATIFVSLPFLIIFAPIVCITGIITTIIAIRQRRNPEQKDAVALVLLIFGILLITLPIILFASIFLGGSGNSTEAEGILLLLI